MKMTLRNRLAKTQTSLWSYILIRVLLVLGAISIFYPFFNCFIISVLPYEYSTTLGFYLIPPEFEFANYQVLLASKSFQNSFLVTLFVTVVGTAYNMFLTITMGYALSRKGYYGRTFFINLLLVTMFFSGGLIPIYLLVRGLGLIDSLFSMILPLGIIPFWMILMKTFFSSIPDALTESAQIDGASDITILIRIIIPVAMPIIATIVLFYAVARWNEWFNGMIYIRTPEKKPLQLFLREMLLSMDNKRLDQSALNALSGSQRIYTRAMQMAMVMLTTLPILCVYPFVQRYFVKGIMIGSIKG